MYSDDVASVWWMSGKGDGTFADALSVAAGKTPQRIVAADLDGDGLPDLATSNALGDDVSVLLNRSF